MAGGWGSHSERHGVLELDQIVRRGTRNPGGRPRCLGAQHYRSAEPSDRVRTYSAMPARKASGSFPLEAASSAK